MTGFIATAEGDLGSIFLKETDMIDRYVGDQLWGCGQNGSGQLGDLTIISKSILTQTSINGSNWKSVACGYYNAAAIKTDGTLWLWGYNNSGPLGDGTTTHSSSPIQTITGGSDWKQVSLGTFFSTAIKTDGTLWVWGNNYYGQLGDTTQGMKSSPAQTICSGSNWKSVSAGQYHTAAIKTDGTLWAWGFNVFGGIGDNTTSNKSSPVQTVAGGTNWKQVSCNQYNTAAIKTDGTLWTWGYNTYGDLGDNTSTHKSSPVQTVAGGTNWKQVSLGQHHSSAIKTDGTLWTWGYNNVGQLGDNSQVHKSSPVQTICSGINWKQVSAGGGGHNTAIKTDGSLWVWGYGGFGQLGDNTVTNKSSPVQTVAGGTNWKQVSAGNNITFAINNGAYLG